ncbi:cytochrome P450 [Streptomyces sp. SID8379]|uniref:cytochrome P450 n=1 Tax=unclassified Streptomyces TaxID=2593676 RepID=UPI000380336C|nr:MULTISPECIES: cytochrome P450 [unclassified Streptomyces]MYW66797.1 cytochrome P450 [Streptomyces sp. SID8379]
MTSAPPAPLTLPAPYGACPFTPPPAYAEVAGQAPVTLSELPDGSPCWLVTGYQEVRSVLSDARFSADARTPGFPFLSPGQRELATARPSFIRMDDPEHARLRRMVTKDFLVRRVEELRPGIQRIVDERLDAMLARGRPGDLVRDFALPIPSLVICLMLGVPYADHDRFQSLSRTLLDNTAPHDEVTSAHVELTTFLERLAELKVREPGDDILSRLAARPDLTPQQVASLGFLLLVTGHESTANMTAISVCALLRHPEQADRLRDDPTLIPGAVEELLRHLTIIHLGLARAAKEDVEVGGVTIRAGEGVICMLSTANREPGLFGEDADTLDLDRDARRHMAFGFGVHQCLGQTLARVELRLILETLLRRVPTLRLAVPESALSYTTQNIVYGLRELPVSW